MSTVITISCILRIGGNMKLQVIGRPESKTPFLIGIIFILCSLFYFPFLNKALHIDSDMLVHTARQILVDPINPPLGNYGSHMVLHDKTHMPSSSIFYRCGHPPLLPFLLAGVIALFGDHEPVFHAFLFLFYLGAVFAVWVLLGFLYPRIYQFYGTLIWTFSPALLVNSHNIMWDVAIAAFMLVAFVLFLYGLRKESSTCMLASGIVTGLAALTKVSALPLYLLIGSYLLLSKRWRYLLVWSVPAVALPMIWVVHNLLVFQKIHFISIGWFSFRTGDIRYRFERFISYSGGALLLPFMWYWLAICKKNRVVLLITTFGAALWGVLLVLVLKKPVWFGLFYSVFAGSGLWILCKLMLLLVTFRKREPNSRDLFLIGIYIVLNAAVLIILPSASIRYMLPVIPCFLILLGTELQAFSAMHQKIFLNVAVITTGLFSLALSYGDYLYCKADRDLPETLKQKGYHPEKTWYYGRLSLDYYLSGAGFKNIRIESATPQPGEFVLNELIPGDYNIIEIIGTDQIMIPIDTLQLYFWPIRTLGYYAGFYGGDRLPYSLKTGVPQKAYEVFRIPLSTEELIDSGDNQ